MASTTTNLGLTKPAYTETADIAVINANMDIIDSAVKALQDTTSTHTSQISTLQNSVSILNGSYVPLEFTTNPFHFTHAGQNAKTWTIDVGYSTTDVNIKHFLLLASGEQSRMLIITGYFKENIVRSAVVLQPQSTTNITFSRSGTNLVINSDVTIYGGISIIWL